MPLEEPVTAQATALAQALIQCPSVTPKQAGALDLLERELAAAGFVCNRLVFGKGSAAVDNLVARFGPSQPAGNGRHLGFAGHIDVVPPGDEAAWKHPPFAGAIENGMLYGRGAVDMKGGVAAFVAAALAFCGTIKKDRQDDCDDSFSLTLLITADEEGEAVHGTAPVLDWMQQNGMMPDQFIVGEPTSLERPGDTIKHGRRGSLSGHLVVEGVQGHAAYPHLADNPLPRLMAMLEPLSIGALDEGNDHFDPSTAAITSIDTANPAGNVIPARAEARFNIRFNDSQHRDELKTWLEDHFNSHPAADGKPRHKITWSGNAEPFVTPPGALTDAAAAAVAAVTGTMPMLSTSGGTSDARFIARYAAVVELGLVGKTMHQVDEATPLDDLHQLTAIYAKLLEILLAESMSEEASR